MAAMQLTTAHDWLTDAFEGLRWRTATFVTDPDAEAWWTSDEISFKCFVAMGDDTPLYASTAVHKAPTPKQVRWVVAASRMKEKQRRKLKFGWGVSAFAMSPNQRVCAMVHWGMIFVADTASGDVKYVIRDFATKGTHNKLSLESALSYIFSMRFSPNGTKLLVGRSTDMVVQRATGIVVPVFDTETGKQCGRVEQVLQTHSRRFPLILNIEPSGRRGSMTIDGIGDVSFETS